MVQVRIENSKDGKVFVLKIKGHSGQAGRGHDIICASVSILAYTVAQVVKTMYAKGKLEGEPEIRLESGEAIIVCEPKETALEEAMHTYSMAQVGYLLLAYNHPQYVELEQFGEA